MDVTLSYVGHNVWVRIHGVLVVRLIHKALGKYLFISMYLLPAVQVA